MTNHSLLFFSSLVPPMTSTPVPGSVDRQFMSSNPGLDGTPVSSLPGRRPSKDGMPELQQVPGTQMPQLQQQPQPAQMVRPGTGQPASIGSRNRFSLSDEDSSPSSSPSKPAPPAPPGATICKFLSQNIAF